MENAVLVVMAAGMGSRFGGLKQIEPVGPAGQIIMDYSILDAARAGFKKVIFIIKEALLEDFKKAVGDRVSSYIKVEYAFQSFDALPTGFSVTGRTKPLGTAHAVYSAKHLIHGPFAVINADDFYGKSAFAQLYGFLTENKDQCRYAMVGYRLGNTLTENGTVSRGVCQTDGENRLTEIIERTEIKEIDGCAQYFENGDWHKLSSDTYVSMNMWGFMPSFLDQLEVGMVRFLQEALPKNPEKGEFYLPFAVDDLMQTGKATVQVLKNEEKWYGITYQEDKNKVVTAITALHQEGIYP